MNIISQNFRNVLKNRLESKINYLTSTFVDNLMNSLTSKDHVYLTPASEANRVSKDIAKEVIIEVIEEFDASFRDSKERKRTYYVSKKDVPRTITTILGDLTFTRTLYVTKDRNEYYFYMDEMLGLPKYDHYDPIVKGLAIRETFYTNQAQAGRIVGERITDIANLADKNTAPFAISRQTIYSWLSKWNTTIVYERHKSTPRTLYIMADEKYIGAQGKDGDIMAKAFVVFEGVKQVSKGRRALINRHVFTCRSSKPWEELLDRLIKIYDYDEIEDFYVLSDGGNWLTVGMHELKLESFQKVEHLLCLFHFKQAIHHITTVEEERKAIFQSFLNDKRKVFKYVLNTYIDKYPHRKVTIEKKIKYVLNHYKAAKHMVSSAIGSSMEAHISHFIASIFASRPKGYKESNINKYFMLNDAKINGINLFNTYLLTYNQTEKNSQCDESACNTPLLKKREELPIVSLPYLNGSNTLPTYFALSDLSRIDRKIKI